MSTTQAKGALPLQYTIVDGGSRYTFKGVARLNNTNRLLLTGREGEDRFKAVIVMVEDSTEVWVMDTTVMTCGQEAWSHQFNRIYCKMGEWAPTQITVLDPHWDSCFPLDASGY